MLFIHVSFGLNGMEEFTDQYKKELAFRQNYDVKFMQMFIKTNIFSTIFILVNLLLGTLLYLFRLVRDWKNKQKQKLREDISLDNFNSTLLPVEIAYLFKTALHIEGVTTTLIDMAQHNYLVIHKEEKRFFFFKKYNYTLIKQKNTLYIPLYENISRILFAKTNYLHLTKENANLYRAIERINNYCKKQGNLKQESWFIGPIQCLCGIIVMVGIPSKKFFNPDLLPVQYTILFALLAFLLVAKSEQRRILTAQGKYYWQKSLLFKDYLAKQSDPIVWQENIAYVFSFSIFKRYIWSIQLLYQHRNREKFDKEKIKSLDTINIHCVSELYAFNKKIISLMPLYQRPSLFNDKRNYSFFWKFDEIK